MGARTTSSTGPTAVMRQRRTTRRVFTGTAILALLTTVVIGIPEVLLARATARAKECLAEYTAPRSPARPTCFATVQPLVLPARIPWTSNRARNRGEEIGSRIAHYDYLDAAVGKPDRQALALAAEGIEHAATVVQNGSTRIYFKELGPSIGAPDLGRDADELGDRRTLVDRGENWFNWRVRLSTLRAALLSGDFARTEALAKRYAVDDPRDSDIRAAVAAVLCMGNEAERAIPMLTFIQDDRAARKYEGLSRDYGEERALIVACAAKAKKPPPPMPSSSPAGSADAVEQRTLLRLRLADPSGIDMTSSAAIAAAMTLLEGGPRSPGARVALLASVLALGAKLEGSEVIRLSKPRFDEAPFAPSTTQTALEWLAERRPLPGEADPAPIIPGATFLAAARAIEGLISQAREKNAADDPKAEDAPAADDPSLVKDLLAIEGALLLEAAATLAREGKSDEALAAADEAARSFPLTAHARGLLRSNVFWLNFGRDKAFAELQMETPPAGSPNAADDRLYAAVSMQRAELALSLGKPDEARSAAERTLKYASSANDPYFAARAKWLLAAMGLMKADPPTREKLAAGTAFSAMGFAHPQEPWKSGDQQAQLALVDRVLAPWVGLSGADAVLRRAGRFAALEARGDAPPWLSLHLLLATRLLAPDEGDVEVWLDALLALDERRFSLRSYAFARAEAARMRGALSAAETWDDRYRALRKLASEPAHLELTRHLDL